MSPTESPAPAEAFFSASPSKTSSGVPATEEPATGTSQTTSPTEEVFSPSPTNSPSTEEPTHSPTNAPSTEAPTEIPGAGITFSCPSDQDLLAFSFVFDANPGEFGFGLFEDAETGDPIWNFGAGSFGSFAVLLREHVFATCLDQGTSYTFDISDVGGNGFVSSLGADVYGSFDLAMNGQIITDYSGNCEIATHECGAYCQCTYALMDGDGSGACSTECDSQGTPAQSGNGSIETGGSNTMTFRCPEGNTPLEIRTYKEGNGENINIRVTDSFRLDMWGLRDYSFGRFSTSRRHQLFVGCFSPYQQYEIEILNGNQDGSVPFQGSFSFKYNHDIILEYSGECDSVPSTISSCGPFRRCRLTADIDGSSGECTEV